MIGDERCQEASDFYRESLIADEHVCASLKLPFDEDFRNLLNIALKKDYLHAQEK